MGELVKKPHNTYILVQSDLLSAASILALLLGRLRLTIPECLVEYRKLSTRIVRDGSPVAPLFETEKLLEVAKEIVGKYEKGNEYLVPSRQDGLTRTYDDFPSFL